MAIFFARDATLRGSRDNHRWAGCVEHRQSHARWRGLDTDAVDHLAGLRATLAMTPALSPWRASRHDASGDVRLLKRPRTSRCFWTRCRARRGCIGDHSPAAHGRLVCPAAARAATARTTASIRERLTKPTRARADGDTWRARSWDQAVGHRAAPPVHTSRTPALPRPGLRDHQDGTHTAPTWEPRWGTRRLDDVVGAGATEDREIVDQDVRAWRATAVALSRRGGHEEVVGG